MTLENRLNRWFGLSYSGWLTLPRVLMQEMPIRWQNEMAKLLEEYDNTFQNMPDIGTRVYITRNGKLTKAPPWLLNYRYPDIKMIMRLKYE